MTFFERCLCVIYFKLNREFVWEGMCGVGDLVVWEST